MFCSCRISTDKRVVQSLCDSRASCFYFFVTRTGHTSGPILTIYTSYDVFPRKNVPFGGCVILLPIYGVKSPKNPNFGGVNRYFPAKHAKYSNFHTTKTIQWIPTKFCQMMKTPKCSKWGQNGLKMCPTNPKWRPSKS